MGTLKGKNLVSALQNSYTRLVYSATQIVAMQWIQMTTEAMLAVGMEIFLIFNL